MTLNKSMAQEMAEELNKLLIGMAARHGLKHYPHRLSWTETSCAMKIEFEAPEAADVRLDECGLFRRGDKVHTRDGSQFIVADYWKGQIWMNRWPDGKGFKCRPEGLKLLQKAKEMKTDVPF